LPSFLFPCASLSFVVFSELPVDEANEIDKDRADVVGNDDDGGDYDCDDHDDDEPDYLCRTCL
jgi:hypothetical protein